MTIHSYKLSFYIYLVGSCEKTHQMATILVVENDADINDSTCEMLELSGHKSLSATDGTKGIEIAITEQPDLILCDIWMTEKDGYEVLDELKENTLTQKIPFVFFTASAEPSEVKRGLAMGASGYICKPFTEEELLGTIQKNLVPTSSD